MECIQGSQRLHRSCTQRLSESGGGLVAIDSVLIAGVCSHEDSVVICRRFDCLLMPWDPHCTSIRQIILYELYYYYNATCT